jgi:hypothetical protein
MAKDVTGKGYPSVDGKNILALNESLAGSSPVLLY